MGNLVRGQLIRTALGRLPSVLLDVRRTARCLPAEAVYLPKLEITVSQA